MELMTRASASVYIRKCPNMHKGKVSVVVNALCIILPFHDDISATCHLPHTGGSRVGPLLDELHKYFKTTLINHT